MKVRARREGEEMPVEVEEEGPGIAETHRTFEPFYATKRSGEGTGIGASVDPAVVEEHGGAIEGGSTGGGACFRARLPAQDGPVPSRASGSHGLSAAPLRSSVARKARILVVDDEEVVREVTELLLADLGHDVACSDSVTDARAALSRDPFDVIICDYHMSGGEGEALLSWAARERPSLLGRFVVTSGDTISSELHDCVRSTGVLHLPKPFSAAQLAHIIEEVLARFEA